MGAKTKPAPKAPDTRNTVKYPGDKCDKCGAAEIHIVSGKTSDLCWVKYPDGREHDGYVPTDLRIATPKDYGDYIRFTWCEACGQMYRPPDE